jgi:hypothetical protein
MSKDGSNCTAFAPHARPRRQLTNQLARIPVCCIRQAVRFSSTPSCLMLPLHRNMATAAFTQSAHAFSPPGTDDSTSWYPSATSYALLDYRVCHTAVLPSRKDSSLCQDKDEPNSSLCPSTTRQPSTAVIQKATPDILCRASCNITICTEIGPPAPPVRMLKDGAVPTLKPGIRPRQNDIDVLFPPAQTNSYHSARLNMASINVNSTHTYHCNRVIGHIADS